MDLQVKSKIFYPSHGAGWVVNLKEIEFCGEKKQYFEFQFVNNSITVSTPVSNVDKLGVRSTRPTSDINKALKNLAKNPALQPPAKDYNQFIELIKELDEEGSLEGFVRIIQYCNMIKEQRAEEKRVIPINISKNIRNAAEYIISEIAVEEDITYDKAQEKFNQLTGMVVGS